MHHETATIERRRPAGKDGSHGSAEESIDDLRGRIDDIDRRLARLMAERTALALDVGRRKSETGVPLKDPAREARVVRNAAERARKEELDEEAVRQIYWCLIDLASRAQRDDRR